MLHRAVDALHVGRQLCNINLGHKHAIVLWIYRAIVCALKTLTCLLNSSLVISFLTTIFITWVLCLSREYILCDCKIVALSSAVLPQGLWWSNSNFMIYHSTEKYRLDHKRSVLVAVTECMCEPNYPFNLNLNGDQRTEHSTALGIMIWNSWVWFFYSIIMICFSAVFIAVILCAFSQLH